MLTDKQNNYCFVFVKKEIKKRILCSFALKTLLRSLSLFFAQAGEKQNTCITMNNVIHLINDEKIYTKHGSFINMLHSNNTCGAEYNHDPL